MAYVVRAGLASVASALGDHGTVLAHVAAIWPRLARQDYVGIAGLFPVCLRCYRVLAAADDPRAAPVVRLGHDLLHQFAGRIRDAVQRRALLDQVVVHRALEDAFAAVEAGERAAGAARWYDGRG